MNEVEIIYTETAKPNKPKKFNWWILGVIVVVLIVGAFKVFEDAFEKVDGKWRMKRSFREKVDDTRDRFDECEVYYLLALQSGFYQCSNCERGTFYLNKGEIFKIGMTCDGSTRYRQSYYTQMRVEYIPIFTGDQTACSKREITELGNYSSRTENMRRPDPTADNMAKGWYKLLYPPSNSSLK